MRIFFTRPHSEILAAPVPLGMMSLSAYLRQHRQGDEMRLFDARMHQTPNEKLIPLIRDFQPDLLCITSFSLESDIAHDLARRVRQAMPDCRIFLGGPYPTADPVSALKDENIGIAFIGEGEVSLLSVLNAIEGRRGFEDIKGIAFRCNGGIVNNGYPDMIQNLDDLPFPAWDLIDLEFCFSFRGKRAMMNVLQRDRRGVSIFTTRGCPYHCTYCHNVFGKLLRKRSPENVVGELKLLQQQYDVREIEILDDIFNLDMDRARAIFQAMEREGLHFSISFPNGLRAEFLDDDLLRAFKRGGVYWITVAIESGSPRVQKAIKKNVNLSKAQENIAKISKAGINCNGFFMMGFMDETEEEIMQTIDFAVKSELVIASFFILTPFPNTEIYKMALEAGHNMHASFSDYHDVAVNLSRVPTKRLWHLKKLANRRFYFSFKRIYLILRANPFRIGLWDGIWHFLKLTFSGRALKMKRDPLETVSNSKNLAASEVA